MNGGACVSVTRTDLRSLRLPWSALLANKFKEFLTKATGRRIKGQGMIGAGNARVREGFGSLVGEDFHEYNLPQAWVERRQIPRVLDGRVPLKDARILDLGCGPGTSTDVLCHFADPSWRIWGYDITGHLIYAARARAGRGEFRNRAGEVIVPEFHCQSIAEPLMVRERWGDEASPLAPVPAASIDLAISGGVVGLYLEVDEARRLFEQLGRVVKPGGFAAIDAGPAVTQAALVSLAEDCGFERVGIAKSFVIEPRPKVIFRKPA